MFNEKEFDDFLQNLMSRWDVPGLAVGVVQNDEILYARWLGVKNLETRAPITAETVFCVQSMGKCFVATAVMQMAEHGQLDLDAPLVRYLPYFQMDDDRCRRITVRQALSHTSGMPDMEESDYIDLVSRPESDAGAAERYVRGLSTLTLSADPGAGFRYSNIAYNVLGDLMAKVAGQPFESVMRERILLPAGMKDSSFLLADIPVERLAWPHLRSPAMRPSPTYPYHRADAPSSFLHVTLADMCHWGAACLNLGTYHGQTFLSRAGFEQMWTAVADRGGPRPNIYEEMGLGWTLGHFQGLKTVSHGGGGFGGTSFLLILPEINAAVVILCNQESSAHYLAAQAAADALLGRKPRGEIVSWMVPVSRTLAEGGIAAASARLPEIQASPERYHAGEGDLVGLAIQLIGAGQSDLAIEVLRMNTRVFPESADSYLLQARLYLRKGQKARARETLLKVLTLEPDNTAAAELMALAGVIE